MGRAYIYTVEGYWPFPLDMLRHDSARAATPEDQILIDRLSGQHSDDGFGLREKIRINLILESGNSRWMPNYPRWESFSWTVVPGTCWDVDEDRKINDIIRQDEAVRQSALIKLNAAGLTDEERAALNLPQSPHW